MKPPDSIGYAVRLLRDTRHWTQVELGAKAGLSGTFINNIENERYYPSFKSLRAIFAAFHLEVALYIYKPGKLEFGTVVLIGTLEHEPKSMV